MTTIVEKISIVKLIIIFIVYIALHSGLFYYKNYYQKTVNRKTSEDEKTYKLLTGVTKWFPAIYLVVTIIILYA
jgi:hypothetical protein